MDITTDEFISKFESISHRQKDVKMLLDQLKQKKFAKGETLLRQGVESDTLYLIWSGSATVSLHFNNLTVDIGTKSEGFWVGELGFIEPGPAAATVTANEDMLTLSLDSEGMAALLKNDPDVVTSLLHALSLNLAERLRETKQYVIQKTSEDEFQLKTSPETQGSDKWYNRFGRILMDTSGGK